MKNLKGLKNDILDQQSLGFFQSSALRNRHLQVFYKKVIKIFIGKKYTADIDVKITLLQTINHLQHCKETWDEAPHLLRFENLLCYLAMENFE